MVKLLHAADLHLDSAFSALPPEKAVQRRAEQRLVLERLTALSEGCAAVLLAGDLFDSARVYRDTLEALRNALAACRCPVFIAPGNHDALLPGSPYLENGWPENVHIFRTAEPERISLPELDIYGAGFLRAEMPAMLDGFRAADPSRLNILVLHGDAENPASPYNPVSPAELAASGLDYAALGHIHRRGERRDGGTLCAWPGCLMGRGFDECGEKGALLVSAEKGACRTEFVPCGARRYERLSVPAGEDALAAVRAALTPELEGSCCRIELTGERPPSILPPCRRRWSRSFSVWTCATARGRSRTFGRPAARTHCAVTSSTDCTRSLRPQKQTKGGRSSRALRGSALP